MDIKLSASGKLTGEVTPPPDKSVSHRAVMFSSLARGTSTVANFLRAADTMSTLNAFRALGVNISEQADGRIVIEGKGYEGLKEPKTVIDCGNSGTTMRLMMGVLASCPFMSVLVGDDSLSGRPMGRVMKPLTEMGARFMARGGDAYAPIAMRGGSLRGMKYDLPVASAQVKSALILAGMRAGGETVLTEPEPSRDHTERMLPAYGVDLIVEGRTVRVRSGGSMKAMDITVPNDFSSAAFFIVAALIVKGSELTVRNVGLNPTRTGLLDVLKRMGADISIINERTVSGEPVGDILCRHSALRAADVGGAMVPSLIDEFPILCIAASMAGGVTTITNAKELRLKESDRIKAMAAGLSAMGVKSEELEDGIRITGGAGFAGADVSSVHDHRIAMAFSVAALAARGDTVIRDAEAVAISFPSFYDELRRLTRQ